MSSWKSASSPKITSVLNSLVELNPDLQGTGTFCHIWNGTRVFGSGSGLNKFTKIVKI
jgi:hypothetical protein